MIYLSYPDCPVVWRSRLLESYMGGGGRMVCPTGGPAAGRRIPSAVTVPTLLLAQGSDKPFFHHDPC